MSVDPDRAAVKAAFTGGGSLDGAALDMPAGVATAVTIDRSGQSWYALDDTGMYVFRFIGYGQEGEIMGRLSREYREAARQQQEAIEAALRPKGCGSCGQTFGTMAAYLIHFEDQEGSRCLPPGARGQLAERDGVWCIRNSDAARR
jgi:hypothetical protein